MTNSRKGKLQTLGIASEKEMPLKENRLHPACQRGIVNLQKNAELFAEMKSRRIFAPQLTPVRQRLQSFIEKGSIAQLV